MEIFTSQEGTDYIWIPPLTTFSLTTDEISTIHTIVQKMSDERILHRVSGSGIPMGIPIQISPLRLLQMTNALKKWVSKDPTIHLEKHAQERLIADRLLPNGDPKKRGWKNNSDVIECVKTLSQIRSVRLSVNRGHPSNSRERVFLHSDLSILIEGQKADGTGCLVIAAIRNDFISVITIL